MRTQIAMMVGDAVIEVGKRIKAGTSELTENEAIEVLRACIHEPMSREQVCDYLNVNNDKFYKLVSTGKIPQGRKRRGFKELYWYRDELDDAMCKYKAKAVTISNLNLYKSVVLFNKHKSYYDYINSIIHEAEHIKQSILYVYDIDDSGEPPAYTIGHLASHIIMLLNLNLNK